MFEIFVDILKQLVAISTDIHESNRLLKKILQGPPHPVRLSIIFKFKNNKNMATVSIGKLLEGSLELDDAASGAKITDAVFSGDEVTSSDDTIATVAVNASDSSKIDVTGVAPGSFTVHVKTNVTYTDSNGEPATTTVEADSDTITVTTEADGVTLKVNF